MLPRPLSETGPLLVYIQKLFVLDKLKAAATIDAVRAMLRTEDGAKFMELLEVSTLLSVLPVISDDRALSARNAQCLIASDLRRIASDETERLLEQATAVGGANRPNSRRSASGKRRG